MLGNMSKSIPHTPLQVLERDLGIGCFSLEAKLKLFEKRIPQECVSWMLL